MEVVSWQLAVGSQKPTVLPDEAQRGTTLNRRHGDLLLLPTAD
jgi:hypothetical protein